MDSHAYDEKTAALIDQCNAMIESPDPAVLKLLSRLRKRAKELDDNALMGYSYYYQAYMIYFMSMGYHTFRQDLTKAARYLLHSGDYEMLGSVYNLAAVDAFNNGNYDVACNYYMTGQRFADKAKEPAMVSVIIETNLARLYNEVGQPERALKHLRKALRGSAAQKKHFRYKRILLAILLNGVTVHLELQNIERAQKLMQRVEKILRGIGEDELYEMKLTASFLRIRLLLTHGNETEAKKQLAVLMKTIRVEEQVHECIEDIGFFCKALVDFRLYKEAKKLIDILNPQIRATDITHVMRIFSEVKIYYYDIVGNEKKLLECLKEQNALLERQRNEQNSTYMYSIDLIDLMREMRDEQDVLRRENEELMQQARTDALTGLANRYTMVRELEAAFERAYRKRTSLGVEILDIDCFKEYNDTYGHRAGDRCLERIAKELLKVKEKHDNFCARYGGDEFVIVYEGMTDEEIIAMAEKIDRSVRSLRMKHSGNRPHQLVTVSQGICNDIPMEKNKLWDFLSEADQALYTIKRSRQQQQEPVSICLKKRPETFLR
ncbi:MAG: diguanylate cyclase [Lachnospiraceae bacterium]|nr:diguanylate cyclase [Lachnospiraceae bacterium]